MQPGQLLEASLKAIRQLLWGLSLFVPSTMHVLAQTTKVDTTTTRSQPEVRRDRLGARFFISGVYALALDEVDRSMNIRPEYFGSRVGALLPVGAQLDILAVSEFSKLPEFSFTSSGIDYTVFAPYGYKYVPVTKTIPDSFFASFRIGIRLYARYRKTDVLVSSIKAIRRDTWKTKVNRTGFYTGINTGPTLGFHERIIRSLPDTWPLNEQIPRTSVLVEKHRYKRWYWNVSHEIGWTFGGRFDVFAGITLVSSMHGFGDSAYEWASRAYVTNYLTGGLSYVLGRSKLDARNLM
ncbi:MAG: hypothetical protein R2817_12620 [Flavobacteriales bacterium]